MFWKCDEKGVFALYEKEQLLFFGYAQAKTADGRAIDTRTARYLGKEEENGALLLRYEAENGLVLTEKLSQIENGIPCAQCTLSDRSGAEIETNRLVPLIANGNDDACPTCWSSLFSKMLLVPYDNDQWNRYEAVPLRVGRRSYELTELLNEESGEGLLFGAIDYDRWKNAIVCSHASTRHLLCISGVADEGTKDVCPHGTILGVSVSSARFVFFFGSDWRRVLEDYGRLIEKLHPPVRWEEGVPFGFNTFAGLARKMSNEVFERTADFMIDTLLPRSFQNNGVVYLNLDGGWQMLPEDERVRIREKIKAKGQKVGLYDGTFVFRPRRDTGFETEIPGCPGHTFAEIMLRDPWGELLEPVDGLYAMDVTHPLWREYTRRKFEDYKEWGYDYLKIDFLSHGAMEGVHFDKSIRTGRQAINKAYEFLRELISPENMGKPFFLSLSIAPLFPCGFGHARRFCCDAFGTNEYIEYVLNTQTYGWWENRTLYDFNDPDHIVLLKSFNIPRDTREGEARARYTTAVISGAMMLLSDDFDRPEAVERALKFACNEEVNAIARSRVAFRPSAPNGASSAHVYTAEIGGETYAAVFGWKLCPEEIVFSPEKAGLPRGTYRDLWSGKRFDLSNEDLNWRLDSCDAMLLKFEA